MPPSGPAGAGLPGSIPPSMPQSWRVWRWRRYGVRGRNLNGIVARWLHNVRRDLALRGLHELEAFGGGA
jgi:hypothetical protein